MITSPVVRYALVLITAVVLQRGVLSQFRVADAVGDALLLVGVAAGVAAGAERGAVVGFCAGLALDLMLPTPLGLGALSYMVAGGVAGLVTFADPRTARWRVMAVCAGASVVGVVTFALIGAVLGRGDLLDLHLLVVAVVVAVLGAVFGPLVVRACRWAEGDAGRVRPALR